MATDGSKQPSKAEPPQFYTETSQPERVGTADTVTVQRAKLELLLEKFHSAAIAAKQAAVMCSIAKQSLATEVTRFENCSAAVSELLTKSAREHKGRRKR